MLSSMHKDGFTSKLASHSIKTNTATLQMSCFTCFLSAIMGNSSCIQTVAMKQKHLNIYWHRWKFWIIPMLLTWRTILMCRHTNNQWLDIILCNVWMYSEIVAREKNMCMSQNTHGILVLHCASRERSERRNEREISADKIITRTPLGMIIIDERVR